MNAASLPSAERPYYARHRRRYAETLRLLPPPAPGAALLDVGIMPGHLALQARDAGYAVTGLSNLAPPAAFRERMERADIRVARADIETDPFPFPDDAFDTVLFCEVLEHCYRDPFAALEEIFRVLKPGGVLILTTPNLADAGKIAALLRGRSLHRPLDAPLEILFPPRLSYTHFREYTARELRSLLETQTRRRYRFRVERRVYSSCWLPGPHTLLRKLPRVDRFAGAAALRLAAGIIPPFRPALMLRARKPDPAAWIAPDTWRELHGFEDLEHDAAPPDGSRRALPYPFRWTHGSAALTLPNPLPGRLGRLRLLAGVLGPDELPARTGTVALGDPAAAPDGPAARTPLTLPPGREFTCLTLTVPPALRNAAALRLTLDTAPWQPRAFGFPDDRELGIMLAWTPILALGT